MKGLLYIAGLDHSGSTLLDKLLGTHPQMIGLGEISLVFKRFMAEDQELKEGLCSCSRPVGECEFWQAVFSEWKKAEDLDPGAAYRTVAAVFDRLYGDRFWLVDSSKYLPALKYSVANFNRNPRVIHQLKDVRAFTVSRLDRGREKGKRKLPFLTANRQFQSWYRGNRRLDSYIMEAGLSEIHVGYEELCLAPEEIMEQVANFIGVESFSEGFDLSHSNSHCLLGNRMRLQPQKQRIMYDIRWFLRSEWAIPALINPHIMRYNRKYVYSNQIDGVFRRTSLQS